MTVFSINDRGKFISLGLDTQDGQGIQVSIPGATADLTGDASLVTSFSAEQREAFSVSQCLNGGMFLYSFGHDPGASQFTLGVTSFIRGCAGNVGDEIAKALSAYRNGRVSKSKALSTLSIGDAALRGYLVGQSMQVSDTSIGLVTTSYIFVALNPQGKEE